MSTKLISNLNVHCFIYSQFYEMEILIDCLLFKQHRFKLQNSDHRSRTNVLSLPTENRTLYKICVALPPPTLNRDSANLVFWPVEKIWDLCDCSFILRPLGPIFHFDTHPATWLTIFLTKKNTFCWSRKPLVFVYVIIRHLKRYHHIVFVVKGFKTTYAFQLFNGNVGTIH